MGTVNAHGFAEAVNDGLVSQRQALVWHLTANHYPPIHEVFVPVAEQAIELANIGDWDETIEMPNGITKSVGEIVDELHLTPFVDLEGEEEES